MHFKRLLVISLLSFFTFAAHADPVCFANKADWAALKARSPEKLPPILSDVPLYLFTPGNGLLSGSMKIDAQKDGHFRMDFTGYHSVGGDQSTTASIKNVCIDGKEIRVLTVDGSDKIITISGSNTVKMTQYKLLTYTFVKGTAEDFAIMNNEARSAIVAARKAQEDAARRAGNR